MSIRDLRYVRDVDPLTVACPICSQPAGTACVSTLQKDAGTPKRFPHAMRKRKAVRGIDWGSRSSYARCEVCGALKAGVASAKCKPCSCPPAQPTVTIHGSDSPTGGDVA